MVVDDILRDLAYAGNTLPGAAMRSALDHWETAGPRFVELLERCAEGADRTDPTKDALFFAIHLLGEKREAKAFPALCRLLQNEEPAESILGDAITENLCGVLIGTYNGDADALKRVIESTSADEYVRAAALDAMAYLTRAGSFTDQEMRGYLLHLLKEMQPQSECFVWTAWADAAANLGYADFAGEVEQLIRRDFVPYRTMDIEDFQRQLRRTLEDPQRLEGFTYDQVGPFTDAIGTLSTWYGFSEEYRRVRERAGDEPPAWASDNELDLTQPYINPLRHVGRNDPCPCGSGKKYKKCCLQ